MDEEARNRDVKTRSSFDPIIRLTPMIEFHPAGLRHAQAMPEHQKHKATVAGFVPAALRGLDQLFHLAAGEVFPVAVVRAAVSGFTPVHHFVESSPLPMAREPPPNG